MTREEKQKAIDALKISAPIMAVTQEEFNTYIQTLNKVMDWLEQEPILDKIRAEIDEVYEELDGCDPDSLGTFACRIDDILDKYKAETEEE